jgi:hypothetical protein
MSVYADLHDVEAKVHRWTAWFDTKNPHTVAMHLQQLQQAADVCLDARDQGGGRMHVFKSIGETIERRWKVKAQLAIEQRDRPAASFLLLSFDAASPLSDDSARMSALSDQLHALMPK